MGQYHIPPPSHSLMTGISVNQNSIEIVKQTHTYMPTEYIYVTMYIHMYVQS